MEKYIINGKEINPKYNDKIKEVLNNAPLFDITNKHFIYYMYDDDFLST